MHFHFCTLSLFVAFMPISVRARQKIVVTSWNSDIWSVEKNVAHNNISKRILMFYAAFIDFSIIYCEFIRCHYVLKMVFFFLNPCRLHWLSKRAHISKKYSKHTHRTQLNIAIVFFFSVKQNDIFYEWQMAIGNCSESGLWFAWKAKWESHKVSISITNVKSS